MASKKELRERIDILEIQLRSAREQRDFAVNQANEVLVEIESIIGASPLERSGRQRWLNVIQCIRDMRKEWKDVANILKNLSKILDFEVTPETCKIDLEGAIDARNHDLTAEIRQLRNRCEADRKAICNAIFDHDKIDVWAFGTLDNLIAGINSLRDDNKRIREAGNKDRYLAQAAMDLIGNLDHLREIVEEEAEEVPF